MHASILDMERIGEGTCDNTLKPKGGRPHAGSSNRPKGLNDWQIAPYIQPPTQSFLSSLLFPSLSLSPSPYSHLYEADTTLYVSFWVQCQKRACKSGRWLEPRVRFALVFHPMYSNCVLPGESMRSGLVGEPY